MIKLGLRWPLSCAGVPWRPGAGTPRALLRRVPCRYRLPPDGEGRAGAGVENLWAGRLDASQFFALSPAGAEVFAKSLAFLERIPSILVCVCRAPSCHRETEGVVHMPKQFILMDTFWCLSPVCVYVYN